MKQVFYWLGGLALLLIAVAAYADYRQDTAAGGITTFRSVTQGTGEVGFLNTLDVYPTGATAVAASSGNVAAATAAASLAATAGVTNYVCGFTITAAGATAAAVVNATLVGLVGGVTLTYTFTAPAGATIGATPLIRTFPRCIPANAANTAITISLPTLGAGNTNAAVTIEGYRL